MVQRTGVCAIAILATLLAAGTVVASPRAQRVLQRVHIVKAGETVWSIARMHQVSPDVIGRANRLRNLDRLKIGDKLIIPLPEARKEVDRPGSQQDRVHIVQAGETLWSIARRHRTSVEALASLNRIGDRNRIKPGQRILLTEVSSIQRLQFSQFTWPSRGAITSRFGFRGKRHHHGIDIAAPVGTPIFAAQDGQVQFVGWMGGYGLLVILNHAGGLTTWYGHASRILVKVGERVRRGQTIARVGATGNVTGPNLHFEVRRNNVPMDPLEFLQTLR